MDTTNKELQSNGVSSSSNSSPDNIEVCDADAICQLNIQKDRLVHSTHPDCIHYLRTGLCGYGSNCRYNHPTYIAQEGGHYRSELPERVGQPDCQYFLKTGTCKFGATCKYHHPRDKHDAPPVPLNILGLPMRQDEKSCPYYMRTGSCKFRSLCKFNHPQPSTLGAAFPITGPSTYVSPGSSVAPPSGLPLIGGYSAWTLSRPPYMSSPHMQGHPAYMPIVLPHSQGSMPVQQGLCTYTGAMSHASTFTQRPNNPPGYPSSSPDQQECQYYIKTGNCKYGTSCKYYHHPKETNSSLAMCTLGPHGLPLRPGRTVCTVYSMYGSCNYGSACRFDHPLVGYYNYSIPPDLLFPDHRSSQHVQKSAETSNGLQEDMVDRKEEVNADPHPHPQATTTTTTTLESPHHHSD